MFYKNRMQTMDKAKLRAEGAIFRNKPKRGWYLKSKFIGYNYIEALDWLFKNGY